MIAFQLTKEQEQRVKAWMKEVDPYDPENPDDWLKHGAIGGAFTYSFTPTSIGICARVYFLQGTPKEQMIDLTDYESW